MDATTRGVLVLLVILGFFLIVAGVILVNQSAPNVEVQVPPQEAPVVNFVVPTPAGPSVEKVETFPPGGLQPKTNVRLEPGLHRAGDLTLTAYVFDFCGQLLTKHVRTTAGVTQTLKVWLAQARDRRAELDSGGIAILDLTGLPAGNYDLEVVIGENNQFVLAREYNIEVWPNQEGTISVNLAGLSAVNRPGSQGYECFK